MTFYLLVHLILVMCILDQAYSKPDIVNLYPIDHSLEPLFKHLIDFVVSIRRFNLFDLYL